MTKQEAFNKVWQHFVVEKNPPSINEKKDCRYRGPNGEKCAFGLFITDEQYVPRMEGMSVLAVIVDYKLEGFDNNDINFFRHLQDSHDYSAMEASEGKVSFHELIKSRLIANARFHKLSIPTVA